LLGFVLYTATFALRWRTLRRMLGIVKSEGIALALEADRAGWTPAARSVR